LPYVNRAVYQWLYYDYSNDIIASNITEATTNKQTPTLIKEFTLKNQINPNSKFRITYSAIRQSGGQSCYIQTYINNVAVGTLRTITTQQDIVEDLIFSDWRRNDKIQIYGYTDNTGNILKVWNVYLKGTGSQWENTL